MTGKRKMVVKIDLGGMKEPAGLPFVVTEVPRKTLTIKEGEYFLYTSEDGEMRAGNQAGLGLYYRDTRYLSILVTTIDDAVPMLLTSSSDEDYMCHIHLCNPDIERDGEVAVPQNCINIRKMRLIDHGLREQIHVQNFFIEPVSFTLSIRLGADFADIFEVRGMRRPQRGRLQNPRIRGDHLHFGYRGLDEMQRTTLVGMSMKPHRVDLGRTQACLHFDMELAPYQVETIELDVHPLEEGETPVLADFTVLRDGLSDSYREWSEDATSLVTDNDIFNLLLRQGMKDLRALNTRTRYGDVIVGGIPWYATPFGRDALVTGFELLMVKPRIARDALNFLALFQGNEVNGWRDEEPGKIIHEIRQGEMARTRVVPHTPYYGTVDATPLFIILAGEYLRWTNDLDFIRSLEGNLMAAARWMDDYGDVDGDGFVEYIRHSPGGLSNQYWKDSWDSLRFPDGGIPEPPIATVETQAYVFYARRRLGEMPIQLGRYPEGERLLEQAEEMRVRFEERFWDEEMQYYLMALDGSKRPVRAVSSNAGHALFTGLPGQERAEKVIARLLSPDMFSGWGIRTLAESASYYNPMSYHNGTVWPHDNALIMRGMKRYGESKGFLTVLESLFEAAMSMQYLRLPELYCGFSRARLDYPVIYPVACQPQAWSSGAIFLIVQSMLGITADAAKKVLFVNRPTLPHWLTRVEVRGLCVGSEKIDLLFRREAEAANFSVLRKSRDMKVIMEE
ncbi:MAG: amylo-alpha-1,6-glucosidase [Candidatus Geothermincolia bacterium]